MTKENTMQTKRMYVAELGYGHHVALTAQQAAALLEIVSAAPRVGQVGWSGAFYLAEHKERWSPVQLVQVIQRPLGEAEAEAEAAKAAKAEAERREAMERVERDADAIEAKVGAAAG